MLGSSLLSPSVSDLAQVLLCYWQAGILPRFKPKTNQPKTMQRITKKQLQARIDTINSILGKPSTPFSFDEQGNRFVNEGVFILTMAYGGYGVGKMSEEGGTWSAIWNGHITARDAYERISAFISGLTFSK